MWIFWALILRPSEARVTAVSENWKNKGVLVVVLGKGLLHGGSCGIPGQGCRVAS